MCHPAMPACIFDVLCCQVASHRTARVVPEVAGPGDEAAGLGFNDPVQSTSLAE